MLLIFPLFLPVEGYLELLPIDLKNFVDLKHPELLQAKNLLFQKYCIKIVCFEQATDLYLVYLKGCFNKNSCSFDDVSKNGYFRSS